VKEAIISKRSNTLTKSGNSPTLGSHINLNEERPSYLDYSDDDLVEIAERAHQELERRRKRAMNPIQLTKYLYDQEVSTVLAEDIGLIYENIGIEGWEQLLTDHINEISHETVVFLAIGIAFYKEGHTGKEIRCRKSIMLELRNAFIRMNAPTVTIPLPETYNPIEEEIPEEAFPIFGIEIEDE
jgi:hypothetical protein